MSTPNPFHIGQPVRLRFFIGRQSGRFTFHRKSLMNPTRCLVWDHWKDTHLEVDIRRLKADKEL